MTPDLVAELLRQLMKEAMILAAPLLIATALLSFLLSLVQTLTSLQEQSLTSVPRLAAVCHDSAGRDALVPGADGGLYPAVACRSYTDTWGERRQLPVRCVRGSMKKTDGRIAGPSAPLKNASLRMTASFGAGEKQLAVKG